MSRAEAVQATFATADNINGLFAAARADEEFRTSGWRWLGSNRGFGSGFFFGAVEILFDGFFSNSILDGDSGFFAGRAIVDIDPTLVEPEFNLFVAGLLRRRHLEHINIGLLAAVEIADQDIGKLGKSAGADVAANVVFIFIHEEESVSPVEVLVKRGVDVSEIFGIVALGRDGTGEVDNVVATSFKIPAPIGGTFLELRAASNN